MRKLGKPALIGSWIAQIVAAFIIGQTLFFKATGAPETVALFDVVGLGPAGRYGSALGELLAVVLLLIPRTAAIGGIVTMGVMTGAIGAHLFTPLGVSIDAEAAGNADLAPLNGPSLFAMALIAFAAGATVTVLRRRQLPVIGEKL